MISQHFPLQAYTNLIHTHTHTFIKGHKRILLPFILTKNWKPKCPSTVLGWYKCNYGF